MIKGITYLIFLSFLAVAGCTLPDEIQLPAQLNTKDFANFDIYIELLPDSTLNRDEQAHQAHALRLMSRAGYSITIYQFNDSPHGEAVIRTGVSDFVGNYKAYGLPLDTYRIVVTDYKTKTHQTVITPVKGKITMLTYGFRIPA